MRGRHTSPLPPAVGVPSLLLILVITAGAVKTPERSLPDSAGSLGMLPARPAATPAGQPSETGVCHVVRPGQTLYSLARAYGVPLTRITEANQIDNPSNIAAGRALFVPGASHPLDVPAPLAPPLAWPLSGRVTSAFGPAGGRPHHEGIDIGASVGDEVRAAAGGRVLWAGTERGYGMMVVIDHGAGLATLYAHASKLLVETDDPVAPGEPIAEVGQSGNARGAHLHFEVRRNGRPVDPLPFLGRVVRTASSR